LAPASSTTASAPCLILFDETLEYLNKALSVAAGDGNLAGTTLTFIKELCTAASNVPGVVVVATLTSSRLAAAPPLREEVVRPQLTTVGTAVTRSSPLPIYTPLGGLRQAPGCAA